MSTSLRLGIGWRWRSASILIVALVVAVGCDKSSPYELAPVHGRLTMGSQPLSGAKVMFAPVSKDGGVQSGKPGVGLTASDGNFTLTTYSEGDGAVVGEHWVTVFVPKNERPKASAPGDPAPTDPTFKRLTVNQKRSVVAGQENVIDISL